MVTVHGVTAATCPRTGGVRIILQSCAPRVRSIPQRRNSAAQPKEPCAARHSGRRTDIQREREREWGYVTRGKVVREERLSGDHHATKVKRWPSWFMTRVCLSSLFPVLFGGKDRAPRLLRHVAALARLLIYREVGARHVLLALEFLSLTSPHVKKW